MAVLEYRTKDGDVLDDILTRHYGRGVSIMQTVLLANPGLAGKGTVYPSGLVIKLPEVPAEDVQTIIRPWGAVGA